MGSDDLFKKRREDRKKRQYEFKQPRADSFLNVTEGKRSEPLYFKGLQQLIRDKIGGVVNIVEAPIIEIRGEGVYKKNYQDIYDLVNRYDGVNTAIRNAKRRMADYKPETCKPSEYDPGTNVYKLTEALTKYLNE